MFRLPRGFGDRTSRTAGGRTSRGGAVPLGGRDRASVRRSRHAARRRSALGQSRSRREVHAERGQRPRRHDSAGLLADRIRHGADLDQPAVRAVLSREASLLSRGRGTAVDAHPGRLHAHHYGARLGRACDRQAARGQLHRARGRRRRRRQRRHPRIELVVARRPGLPFARLHRPRAQGSRGQRPVVRQHAHDRSRKRGGRSQSRPRPGLPAALQGHRDDCRAMARERYDDAEPAGCDVGMDRNHDEVERRPVFVEPQHRALRRVLSSTRTSDRASAPTADSCRRSAIAKSTARPAGRFARTASSAASGRS